MSIIIKTKKNLFLSSWRVEKAGKIVPEVEKYYLCLYNHAGSWEGMIFDTEERMNEAFNFIEDGVKKGMDFIDLSGFDKPEVKVLS